MVVVFFHGSVDSMVYHTVGYLLQFCFEEILIRFRPKYTTLQLTYYSRQNPKDNQLCHAKNGSVVSFRAFSNYYNLFSFLAPRVVRGIS